MADNQEYLPSLAPDAFTRKIEKFAWCAGYLEATRDAYWTTEIRLFMLTKIGVKFEGPDKAKQYAPNFLRPACIPDKASTLQLARVLVKWLRDHPERLHELKSTLVMDAFQNAFPCESRAPAPTEKNPNPTPK